MTEFLQEKNSALFVRLSSTLPIYKKALEYVHKYMEEGHDLDSAVNKAARTVGVDMRMLEDIALQQGLGGKRR